MPQFLDGAIIVQLYSFCCLQSPSFTLFCGYPEIGDRDYMGFYIWDDDFFSTVSLKG